MADAPKHARRASCSLQEAADLLGVHYMTAYRYVRTGRLVAERRRQALVRTEIEHHVAARRRTRPGGTSAGQPDRAAATTPPSSPTSSWKATRPRRGASARTRSRRRSPRSSSTSTCSRPRCDPSATSGKPAASAWPKSIGPARSRTGSSAGSARSSPGGARRAASSCSEHPPATATASRPRSLADPLRGRGFAVADLGADTPAASFAEIVTNEEATTAVGIAVSVAVRRSSSCPRRSRRSTPRAPSPCCWAGARSPMPRTRPRLGADAYSDSAARALAWFDAVNARS